MSEEEWQKFLQLRAIVDALRGRIIPTQFMILKYIGPVRLHLN